MQNILGAIEAKSLLAPVDAANTAAATSGWVDVRFSEGLILVVLHAGVLDAGTLDWTFEDANTSGGGANAAITPDSGALTQVTTSNDDPNIQLAYFDARKPRGWLKVIGTIVTGGALVSAQILHIPKY